MIITRTQFRNLKSYGNKTQQVDFDTNDRLILLTGTNGYGKSSILESISLSMFGIVNGKKDKKIPLVDLPNRMNKSLFTSTEFYNNNNDYIKINRYITPNKFEISINGEKFTDKFKKMSPDERTDLIGANYNTFKSFISLDLNTFSDFISLREDTKRNLVNKLFNLEELDKYYYTTVELINQNNNIIQQSISEIKAYGVELNNLKRLIDANKVKMNVVSKDELKIDIINKKNIYQSKKESVLSLRNEISDFSIKIQEYKNQADFFDQDNYKRRIDLNDIISKVKIHENGSCPYCTSDLKNGEHENTLSDLLNKKELLLAEIINNDEKSTTYKDEGKLCFKQKTLLEETTYAATDEYNQLKAEMISLKKEYDNYVESDDTIINELKSKGKATLGAKKEKVELIEKLKSENISLNKLKDILSENGVRNDITSSLIVPINERLSTFLKIIKFPYKFELDENFDGILIDKGDIVNHETLSNGESRILNLCIALSYIDMILKTNDINILFMDEVFSSIAVENITEIVKLLKQFSIDNEISLILVHHGLEQLDSKLFDKIITVEKDLFSDIKIK